MKLFGPTGSNFRRLVIRVLVVNDAIIITTTLEEDPATPKADAAPLSNLGDVGCVCFQLSASFSDLEESHLYLLFSLSKFVYELKKVSSKVSHISYTTRYPLYQQNLFQTPCRNSS